MGVLKHKDDTVSAQKHLGSIAVLRSKCEQLLHAQKRGCMRLVKQVIRHFSIINRARGKRRCVGYATKQKTPCR
jgi:hypothetical protein